MVDMDTCRDMKVKIISLFVPKQNCCQHFVLASQFKGGHTPSTQYFVDGCYARLLLCILTGASPLQHKDKVPAGAAH